MSNPIIGRPDAFTRHGGAQQQAYAQGAPQYGTDPYQTQYQQPPVATGGVMTLDDVLAKTAITLGVVALAAAATFLYLPMQFLYPALIGSALVGLVTVFFVAAKSRVPVGGVLFYAAIEGVFVGAISKFFELMYPGIVVTAVLATFVTAGATLAAYKFFNIKVSSKFRRMVFIGTAAYAGVLLVNFILSFFGLAFITAGSLTMFGLIASAIGVGLAVFNLILDFDYIEQGIAMGAPATESWRAAFGLTVTMVWLYIEMLRLLSYFRSN